MIRVALLYTALAGSPYWCTCRRSLQASARAPRLFLDPAVAGARAGGNVCRCQSRHARAPMYSPVAAQVPYTDWLAASPAQSGFGLFDIALPRAPSFEAPEPIESRSETVHSEDEGRLPFAGSVNLHSPLGLVLGGVPNLMQWAQYWSNLVTVWGVTKSGTTSGYPIAPYVALFLCGYVWLVYGTLRKDIPVIADAAGGVLAGLVCCGLYSKVATQDLTSWMLLIVAAIASITYALVELEEPEWWLGRAAVVTDIALCAAPLVVLPTVLSDHNSASIPLLTAVVTAVTSASWVSYGYFVANDPIVWIAAGSGMLSALVQVGAHMLYPEVAVVADAAMLPDLMSVGT